MIAPSPQSVCRVCAKPFLRFRTTQAVCGPKCAEKLPRMLRKLAAGERRQTRASLEAIKPRAKWLAEAQSAFNAYVRARDARLPCISCGRFHEGAWDAGHYLTTGARPELRFDEDNVHRQCVPCNRHLHGNLIAYRVGLIQRLGLAVVERLEGPQEPKRYTVNELRQIRDGYRRKARELQRQLEKESA